MLLKSLPDILQDKKRPVRLLFVAALAVLGVLLLINSQAITEPGTLYITPGTNSAVVDQQIEVEVRINPTANVDGVEAEVTYDPTKLEYISMDATSSAFEVGLGEQTGGNGVVKFTRGTLQGAIDQDSLVTKLTFKALASDAGSELQISGNATSAGAYTNPATQDATVSISSGQAGTMFLQPPTLSVAQGKNVTIDIMIDPENSAVDGVEAELAYETGKLEFVSIDGSNSPFTLELGTQTGGNGKVTITRGILGSSIDTEALVARVTFKALSGIGTSTISLSGNATSAGSYTNPQTNNSSVTFSSDSPDPSQDNTPPTVKINSPAANSSVLFDFTVQVSATDDTAVDKVELYIDGSLADTDTAEPYQFNIDTDFLSNGPHTLVAKAYDTSGNVGDSQTIEITVKNWKEDIDQDGVVGILDFSLLSSSFGKSGTDLGRVDINRDGKVDITDFNILFLRYGESL